jgi:cyclic pyranopterin phosphate synthase
MHPVDGHRARARRSLPIAFPARVPPKAVRVSLTDRCDLACVYCRPSRSDGYFESRIDDEAWKTMLRALVQAGIRRIRVTGGEPLLHPRVVELVRFAKSLGIEDLALTTNGTRLAALARSLREAGLDRLTVSLDSLVPERFWRMTRGGQLDRVLAGIDAAQAAGYAELKTNTVVLRGENVEELCDITTWAWGRGITPRFIEVMRVGEGARLAPDALVSAREMRARLTPLLRDEPGETAADRGPARYVRARADGTKVAGFITGATDTYCDSCDRLRVASDGTLRPCLATNDGVSAMGAARAGDVGAIVEAVHEAWRLKPDGRVWKGCTEKTAADVSMRSIGG